MTRPIRDGLPDSVRHWPDVWADYYAERAAMMEYDGQMSRRFAEFHAEYQARREFIRAKKRQGFADLLRKLTEESEGGKR